MRLMTVGINHETAPIHIREKFSVPREWTADFLKQILNSKLVYEAVVLSTCNRTEIYVGANSLRPVLKCLVNQHGCPVRTLQAHGYAHHDRHSVRHLMRVASGLDSLILGEAEILGQLKSAFSIAKSVGGIGKYLDRLFQYTFQVAKQVRSRTLIGDSPVSVAYAAVRLAQHVFSEISHSTVLVVGAGETAALLLKHLQAFGVQRIFLSNRTLERAHALAEEIDPLCHLEILDLQSIPSKLAEADIVITSTTSPLPIIGKGMVERALRIRKHRPMFMVDVSVPRNIEPEVGQLPDVYLYGIDDLRGIVSENQASRRDAAFHAQQMIDQEVDQFMGWLRTEGAVQVIRRFRDRANVQHQEIKEEALAKLRNGQEAGRVLEQALGKLVNRLLHEPTVQLRRAGFEGDEALLDACCALFKLNSK